MANRNSYTYTPGYAGSAGRNTSSGNSRAKAQPPQQRGQQSRRPPARPAQARTRSAQPAGRPMKDRILFLMIAFDVLLCFVGLIFKPVLWFFVAVSVICIIALWALLCYTRGVRAFLSGVLAVLTVIALVVAIDYSSSADPAKTAGGFPVYGGDSSLVADSSGVTPKGNNAAALAGLPEDTADTSPTAPVDWNTYGQDDGTVTDETGGGGSIDPQPTDAGLMAALPGDDTQAPVNEAVSLARASLEGYLEQWVAQNYEEMTKYTSPVWRAAQDQTGTGAKQQLYWNHNWWVLNSWSLSNEDTSPAADSVTFMLIADLRKSNNAMTPVKQRYSALVIKAEDGKWYVDPDSLRSGVPIDEVADTGGLDPVTGEPTPEPVATVAPTTKLWYNSDGGTYYHLEEKCSTIGTKYYSKMKSFTYGELGTSPYDKLVPCSTCKAPAK